MWTLKKAKTHFSTNNSSLKVNLRKSVKTFPDELFVTKGEIKKNVNTFPDECFVGQGCSYYDILSFLIFIFQNLKQFNLLFLKTSYDSLS